MEHWDIKAAFINAPLEEDIWIFQPDGHQQQGAEDMVCKLNKALYGLKQAGRAWQKLLKSMLAGANFSQLIKLCLSKLVIVLPISSILRLFYFDHS